MIIATLVLAATSVFRLELTDDVPYVVGADGERRQVVLVEPEQYAMLTGRLDQVWRSMNADENSRIKLHGMRVDQRIDEKTMEKYTIYKDGFVHVDRMMPKTTRPRIVTKKQLPPTKPSRISKRHWDMMKKRNENLSKPAKEVTVEHDALTGKDIVK